MRVLLDTQVLVLAGLDEKLPARTLAVLRDTTVERLVSTVSITEIAIKSGKGSLPMTARDTDQVIRDLDLTVIPYTAAHASRLFTLPPHHRDPFDRMLIATALTEDIAIVSNDRIFKHYRGLRVIW